MDNSLLLGILDWILALIDNIPQSIYFLFATLASGIDVMQCFIRKLAGLDVYYSAETGEALAKTDPLTEFIYGILGIGNSSSSYKALNTVFWSMAIFAVILLALTTIVAMVKSHYSEDAAGTSPWKFIYTAIKSVLTFAVVPVMMVLGLKLSSFVLNTLDNITAGTANDEVITDTFGPDATTIFVGEKMSGSDTKSYIYYDLFGFGVPTNSTPLGSSLFKAAAMGCNRARLEKGMYTKYLNLESGGKQIFGNTPGFDSLTEDEKQELVAAQIDFLFCNHVKLADSMSQWHIGNALDGEVVALLQIFPNFSFNIGSFSKFNVTAVWWFYNLWAFNFIVALAGGITMLGILLSIIVGLMTRLIKGAALFLVYAPLLGIAPLDNFKAFKSWAQMMIQQVMMSFGAILGVNIVMLLLPLIQNIEFFGILLIDAMVSMIVVIVALLIAKEFTQIVSGFAGGADAASSGEGIKGQIGGVLKKSASIAGKVGGGALRIGGAAAIKAGKGIHDRKTHNRKVKLLNQKQAGKLNTAGAEKLKAAEADGALNKTIADTMKSAKAGRKLKEAAPSTNEQAFNAAKKAVKEAKAGGVTDTKELDKIRKQAIVDSLKSQKMRGQDGKVRSTYDELEKQQEADIRAAASKGKAGKKEMAEYKRLKEAEALNEEDFDVVTKGKKAGQFAKRNAFTDLGAGIKKGFEEAGDTFKALGKKMGEAIDGVSLGKTIANSFGKSIGALGEATGLDKVFNGAKDIFKDTFTMAGGPFENKKPEGDKLHAKIAEGQAQESQKQTAVLKQVADELTQLRRVTGQSNKIQSQTLSTMKKTNTLIGNSAKEQEQSSNKKTD